MPELKNRPAPPGAPDRVPLTREELAARELERRREERNATARIRERTALVGLVLLAAGCGLVYPPAGLIAPAVYLLAISFPRKG